MAFLIKRGRVYYVNFYSEELGKKNVRKSLGTRHKDIAQKMVTELEKLESLGKINPFSKGFNPKKVLQQNTRKETVHCNTVSESIELFYKSKSHLSPATIGAYQRALDHFVELNELADEHPTNVLAYHFENVIFKKGITSATRHYYFRHYRSWWKFLLKKKIVEKDYFPMLKEDLPRIRENTRPKMISEEELGILFKKFDEELERKKDLPEFDPNLVQHWFKPIVALYFYGGLRKHEAAYDPELSYSGLKGENLIYEDGELSYISLPPTKGRKERLIPIINELKEELDSYLEVRGKLSPSDFVFIYTGGNTKGQPVRGMRVYREFKRYCKEAGIPTTRTLHGMRHQAVTTWIEKGFHTAEASYMAGHSNQKVTEKYTHLTVKRLKEKMNAIKL